MSFVKAFEVYQIRWNIEVMNKETKQYLGLGGYQGCDFNGQIADATLCYLTYTVMALEKRFTEYQTMGELFRIWRVISWHSRYGSEFLPASNAFFAFRRNTWNDAPIPYGYNQRKRQRDEQNPCNG